MRVLVTGNRGYIGTVLVEMLLEEEFDFVGLDSDLYRECSFGDFSDVPTIEKDVRDVEASDLEGVDAVAHLAGLSNDPLGDLDPTLTDEINHRATVRLAALSKEVGIQRFVFSSSCSTYGASGNDFIDENGEFNPVTPYGVSKVDAERGLSELSDSSFSPTFLRNATAYGVSPRLRFDLVVNNLVAWGIATGKILLKSDGTPWRPIVHIRDISRAFISVLKAPLELVHNEAFNVGSTDENYQIGELAELVQQVVPDCTVTFADGAGPDKRCYRVNCDRIRKTLPDFETEWTARRGVQELFDAYRGASVRVEDFEGRKYKRIDHIRHLISTGALDTSLRWNRVGSESGVRRTGGQA